jgi:predicted nucleic acid-binding protein
MAILVLDASSALAIFMPDEKQPLRSTIDLFESGGALCPATWPLEIGNMLLIAEKRRRIPHGFRKVVLDGFERLSVDLDDQTADHAWKETLALASQYNLTTYDAAYLELALRSGLPLATIDGRLRAAAIRARVTVLD